MKPELQLRIQRYGWDRASQYYDHAWQQQLKPAQDELLKMAALKNGEHVLDIACGTGLVTKKIASRVGPQGLVVGTDISEKMLEVARSHFTGREHPPTYFHHLPADHQDFPTDSFDVSTCALGYMYFPNSIDAAREQYRILKPGGRAVAAVWGERSNCGWAGVFPIVDRRVKTQVCPMFFHLGTGDTLSRIFWMAGFSKIITSRIKTMLFYPSAQEATEAIFSGGPVAMAYARFDEQTKAEVHEEYLESIAPFREGNGYAIPGEYVITRGIK